MSLFTEFETTNAEQWKQQLIKDLKGITFDNLKSTNQSGIEILPFYTGENLQKKEPIFRNTGWDICEHIIVHDEVEANLQALEALKGGVSGLSFLIHKKIKTEILIKDISLEHIYTQFFISNDALHVLDDLKNYYAKPNSFDGKIKCFVNCDVLGLLAFYGEWHKNEEDDLITITKFKHLSINSDLYQNAGANAVNELAIALSQLNEYLNYLTETNSFNHELVHINCAVGSDFFGEMAKLRAYRNLIANLFNEYKLKHELIIQANTTQINKSHLDSYTNILRSSTEAMSAVIGGCNSLAIIPYNLSYEASTPFSRRMARNQQHILKEESYLDKVADMAAGSYYIETLTEQLCEKAWEKFKELESKGGFIKCIETGFIQEFIEKDVQRLIEKINSNEQILVGVNKFQNATENPVTSSQKTATKKNGKYKSVTPINLGEMFTN